MGMFNIANGGGNVSKEEVTQIVDDYLNDEVIENMIDVKLEPILTDIDSVVDERLVPFKEEITNNVNIQIETALGELDIIYEEL